MKPEIKVEFKKLGKNKALGLAYKEENKIILDPRLKGKDFIDVAIHELMHILLPYLTEETIDSTATSIATTLTKLGVIKSEKDSSMI